MARAPGKKQQIIDAAIVILSERGAPGLTAANLASAAGVSKANLFHHFDSLDDIVVAALERFLMSMPAMTPSAGISLRDWLIALGAETEALMERRSREASAYVAFMARAQSDERLRGRLVAVMKGAEEAFSAAIRLLAPGRFDDVEIARLANLIVMTGDGLAIHRALFPSRARQQQAAWLALVDAITQKEQTS